MKKYIIYIVILVVGFLLGMLFFGDSSEKKSDHNHEKAAQEVQMWTCSMHPQIMQPEAGSCPICGMDLIPVIGSDKGLSPDQFKLTENAMALANIQTSVVGDAILSDKRLILSGKIAENEETNSVQVSYFSGRIEKLYINATGVQVRKGQLLANIYAPELITAQQELITASSLKDTQPELYKAVRNKLKLWKLSEKQINQIESSKQVKEQFSIYATVSGTVIEKKVSQGDAVKQGATLFKIADLSSVWAVFDLYENQIHLVKKGQKLSVVTSTYPNRSYQAKVSFIDPLLDPETRTVKLRTVLSNPEQIFKPGMFVEAKIQSNTSTIDQGLVIPSTAILWTGKRSVVYVKVNPDEPLFEMKEVSLGARMGEAYEVLEGLSQGDEIVTNGTFTIDAAAQLQGKKSMMNKDGGSSGSLHKGHGHSENMDNKTPKVSTELHQRVTVSTEFKQQLRQVFDSYIIIKDALVADDAESVSTNSQVLIENLSKVDMKLLTDSDAHQHWMKVQKEIKASAEGLANTSKIKEQRNYFKDLSTHITSVVQMFGVGQTVYNQYCPMADNDRGAYWLSNNKNVLNPYFGSAMLACGSVKQVIDE